VNEFNVTLYVDQSSPIGMNKKAAVIGPRDNCLRTVARIHDIISGRWQPGQQAPQSDNQAVYEAYYAAQAAAAQATVSAADQAAQQQQMTPELMQQWLEYYTQYYASMGQPVPPEILASLGGAQS
jgi:hypothetical protein